MNENKKLDIIRSMLNALLGNNELEDNRDNEKNKLKKKYIEKSKKAILFYRKYMNVIEQQELEKFTNLYDIILNNSFEYSEKDDIDTYMYCNVFPMLKKTFDSFVLYVSKLITHKNDDNYKNIIKNFDPILLFSQYIIRLTDEDFSLSDDNVSDINFNDFSIGNNKIVYDNKSCSPINKNVNLSSEGIDEEISDFYNQYDTLMQENKLKEKREKQEILKCIYQKQNSLSEEEISLYDNYYEEYVKLKGTLKNENDSSFYGNSKFSNSRNKDSNIFNLSLNITNSTDNIKYDMNMKNDGVFKKKKCQENESDDFNRIIKQIERKESSYFEKKIFRLLNKWIKEEEGRRFIINQKSKIEPLFNDFKRKNHTVTDKDIISLLFFIDKNLYLNYSLVHQYNYNNFHYIFHLHSSFYCSDTNSITFEELWDFIISNLPLNNHLYKENILKGLEKFEKKKELSKNFNFTITFIKSFLIFILIDIFMFFSNAIKTHISLNKFNFSSINFLDVQESKVELKNFFIHVDSLSPFFASSSEELSEESSKYEPINSYKTLENTYNPSNNDNITNNVTTSNNDNYDISSSNLNMKETKVIIKNEIKNNTNKENILINFLLLLWGININFNLCSEEFIISDELSTDIEEEDLKSKNNKCNNTNISEKKRRNSKSDIYEYKYQSDDITIKRKSNKNFQRSQSTSLNLNDKICCVNKQKLITETIKNKQKIDIEKLKKKKKRKKEKFSQNLHELRKFYYKKNYNEEVKKLLYSIVKNIKPNKKNYYEKIINKIENNKEKIFLNIFEEQNLTNKDKNNMKNVNHEKKNINSMNGIRSSSNNNYDNNNNYNNNGNDDNDKSIDNKYKFIDSLTITSEKEIMCYLSYFIKTYIKKKKKKNSYIENEKKVNETNEEKSTNKKPKNSNFLNYILMLCNFKLYKKKFLDKFKIQHIYLLFFFVHYINIRIDSLFNDINN